MGSQSLSPLLAWRRAYRVLAAFRAISDRRSGDSLSARAFPPFRPPSLPSAEVVGSLSVSSASSTSPVAISTISFPSWIGSRGRLRRRVAMLVIWHGERRSETRRQGPTGVSYIQTDPLPASGLARAALTSASISSGRSSPSLSITRTASMSDRAASCTRPIAIAR